MAEKTGIEWTDHTFNGWWGCTKVSPGCDECYADTLASRYGFDVWGHGKPRRLLSDKNWNEPIKWNGEAEKSGVRRRVFCSSMADVFDTEVPTEWRVRLFDLIRRTPSLDWLLLTKRPAAVMRLLNDAADQIRAKQFENCRQQRDMLDLEDWIRDWIMSDPPENVWVGASCEDQKTADVRIPALLKVPAVLRFLSCEPLLGPIELFDSSGWSTRDALQQLGKPLGIDWVIVGGESGHGARPMHPDWARSLRHQCQAAGIPFFFKQQGEWVETKLDSVGIVRANRTGHPKLCTLENHEVKSACDLPGCLTYMERVGKKKAGDLLDGARWHEFPVLKVSIEK